MADDRLVALHRLRVIWLVALIPIEVMQARLARQFATEAAIPERYWRLSTLWSIFGAVATLSVAIEIRSEDPGTGWLLRR